MAVQPTRILVLGAGYAGLLSTTRLAGKLARQPVSITLVNQLATFTERPRLHQYATNQPVPQRSIPELLHRSGVRFVQGTVTRIVPDEHAVEVQSGGQTQRLQYDYLVYALGSLVDRQRVPGVDQYAYTLAPRGPLSAEALRAALPALQASAGRVLVCGGGATGIETAAEIAKSYPRLNVQLVTQGAFGMHFGAGIARYMRRSLAALGVVIRDHATVRAVRADGVEIDDGTLLPYDLCLWAGGFVAPTLARDAGLQVNDLNQIIVDPYLRAVDHPEIFVVGDAAHPRVNPGVPVRMSAFTAAILGAYGADALTAFIRGRTPPALSFVYLGQGIALGRHNTIGFNNYPNDKPNHPYFTGRVAYELREVFVRFLAAAPAIELRWPGFFFWLGKRRYRMVDLAAHDRHGTPQRAPDAATPIAP